MAHQSIQAGKLIENFQSLIYPEGPAEPTAQQKESTPPAPSSAQAVSHYAKTPAFTEPSPRNIQGIFRMKPSS